MAHVCWTCGNEQYFAVKVGVLVGRYDECPHCGADLRCCMNCQNHDPNVHNQCKETTAEFIRDRERANFCAHFAFRDADGTPARNDGSAAQAKLAAMFKNFK